MKNTHKILLFTLLFFLALLGFFVVINKNGPVQEGVEAPPLRPKIPNYVSGEVPVEFLISKEEFVFPEKLRLLSVEGAAFPTEKTAAIAKALGFEGGPEEFEDIKEGIKYYWRNKERFLVITPKTGVVKFGPNREGLPVVSNKQLGDEELVVVAIDFLSESSVLPKEKIKGISVSPLGQNKGNEGLSEVPRGTARVFQVNLSYSVSDFEMLTINPSSPLVQVKVLPDGTIFSAEIYVFESVSLGLSEYKVKTYEEVSASVSSFKLVSILNGFLNLADLSAKDIQKAAVEKISLSYLYESPGSKYLQPVFVLRGPVTVPGSEANEAVFYLPAISSQP